MSYNFLKPDYKRGIIIFEPDWEDEDSRKELPAKMEVCGRCDGRGVHDPDGFSNGFTREDFAEDPDFAEDYFAGKYDVKCTECGGRNVVLVIDRDKSDPVTLEVVDEWMQEEDDYLRIRDMERRMGC